MNRFAKAACLIGSCLIAVSALGCQFDAESALLDKTKDKLLGAAAVEVLVAGRVVANGASGVALNPGAAGGGSTTAFEIRNKGGRPLVVIALALSSGDGALSLAEPPVLPLILEPDESLPFSISFSSGRNDAPRAAGVEIRTSDQSAGIFSFSVLGRVLPGQDPAQESWRSETIAGYMPYHDGVGGQAGFASPDAIAGDGSRLYVACGNVIRSIDTDSWQTNTLAGSPDSSAQVLDGAGEKARFYSIDGIACDATDLYILDYAAVRRMDLSTHEVSTLAGEVRSPGSADGTGISARFSPYLCACVDDEAIYVADRSNYTIRVIAKDTLAVSTLAGLAGSAGTADGTGASARFGYIRGIASLGSYLYVIESTVLRMVEKSSGAVTTIAGSASTSTVVDGTGTAAGFSNLMGIAAGENCLFLTEQYYCVRRVSLPGYQVTTVAGTAYSSGYADGTGPAARFNSPQGACMQGSTLYIADSQNGTIRAMDPVSYAVSTVAGTPTSKPFGDGKANEVRFGALSGLTRDGNEVFIADTGNHLIRRLDLESGEVTAFAGSPGVSGSSDGVGATARFNSPYGLFRDGGYLYVADSGNYAIRRIVLATAEVTTIAGTAGQSGAADGLGAAARFRWPRGIAGNATTLYVSEYYSIRAIDMETLSVTTIAGQSGSPGYLEGLGSASRWYYPEGLLCFGTNLYVCDRDNSRLRGIDLGSGQSFLLAGNGNSGLIDGYDASFGGNGFGGPRFLAQLGDSLYVTDTGQALRKVSPSDGLTLTVAGGLDYYQIKDGVSGSIYFQGPTGIAATADGRLVIADYNSIRILKREM
jgi:hypothetical protein